jgi:thiamine biosynthesis lipoprotein
MKLTRRQAILGIAAGATTVAGVTVPGRAVTVSRPATAFGTTVRITITAHDVSAAEGCISAGYEALRKVEKACNLVDPKSELSILNAFGELHNPTPQFLEIMQQSQALWQQTDGAFDATVQKLWEVWAPSAASGRRPLQSELSVLLPSIGMNHVLIAPNLIRRSTSATLTLNGIARGYAADAVAKAIRPLGAIRALLDTDEFALDGNGDTYHFAIAHPRAPSRSFGLLQATSGFIATSGDYNTTFTPDFSANHIFDPKTGHSPGELASATVIAPTGSMADGLATAFMVMGIERARSYLSDHAEYGALLVTKDLTTHDLLGRHGQFRPV